MIVFELIVLWIINSFKWFSYWLGISFVYFLFSKDVPFSNNTISKKDIIQCLLLVQPLAIANIFNHYEIEGKLVFIVCAFAAIPGLISVCKHN